MSSDARSASEWLGRARQNAARFAGLLEADAADLRKSQTTPDAAQAAARIDQVQRLLDRIIAELDEKRVPEQEINRK